MNEYIAPLRDMRFVLQELADIDGINKLPGYDDVTPDFVDSVLEEASKFASGVLSPINRSGDVEGAKILDGNVVMPSGWREAYKSFSEAGWNSLSTPAEEGGQGLPQLVASFVDEMWHSANVAFALCPMLGSGAITVLMKHGSNYLKKHYLPKLVSGEWAGTMVLTEPQAGSDLAAVRTSAIRQADGTYRLHGQKIFITYGEHDLTPNIGHLVLARAKDAPGGTKGISLFFVPKILVNPDDSLGDRNDIRCVSLEHKLGIHASPTCVLAFGDNDGAVGYLIGDENRGLEYMFVMMNAARFAVGLQGLSLSERAYQCAVSYARERIQGTDLGQRVPIIRHPDVRRMLLSMKSRIEGMRALSGVVAAAMDKANSHPELAIRESNQALVDLMMPVIKGWFTENGVEITSLAIQVHGGMGFIEETGVAQHLRDARITTIYEGTTGIQAADLVGRKVAREQGRTVQVILGQMRELQKELVELAKPELIEIAQALGDGIKALDEATAFVTTQYGHDPKRVHAGAVPYMELLGIVSAGWQMARAALASFRNIVSGKGDTDFYQTKIHTFPGHWFRRT